MFLSSLKAGMTLNLLNRILHSMPTILIPINKLVLHLSRRIHSRNLQTNSSLGLGGAEMFGKFLFSMWARVVGRHLLIKVHS